MTAIIVAAQPSRGLVHLVTDAAIYRTGEGVVRFRNKVAPIPHFPMAITGAGNAAAGALFAQSFAGEFSSFDDVIERAPALLPDMAASYGMPTGAVMILAGISAERGAEVYSFSLDDAVPPTATREEMEASEYHAPPFRLVKLPDQINTPVPPLEMSIAANYEGIDVDGEPELVAWQMRKLLFMQRHMVLPESIGGIGGFGELTTVSKDGVSQRIIQRWPEDKLGAPLRPGPMDWDQWHAANPKPATSRLRRDMLERKARRSDLRVVR